MHWIYSKKKFLEDILTMQDIELKEEKEEKATLEVQLANMKKPFGFV